MKIQIGNFYFIDDEYYDYVGDSTIPRNKGKKNRRPMYCVAIEDDKYYWLIPISSKVSKYQIVYNKAIKKYGRCDSLIFGYVQGNKRVFLIQNIFPITKKYFVEEYLDSSSKKPIIVSSKTRRELFKAASKVINLYYKKNIKLFITDVDMILNKLK